MPSVDFDRGKLIYKNNQTKYWTAERRIPADFLAIHTQYNSKHIQTHLHYYYFNYYSANETWTTLVY